VTGPQSALRFCGTTRLLKQGDAVPESHPEITVTGDAASALAGAWRIAGARGGTARVYALGLFADHLVVFDEVQVDLMLEDQARRISESF
jgi:hypothetical protein